MQHRDAQVTIVMGKNGTGKSTFCQKIINGVGDRALVVTLNGAPKIWRQYPMVDAANKKQMAFKNGIAQCWFMQHDDDTYEHIYKNFGNGMLIFDDCRGYLGSNVDQHIWFKRLLMDFRHKMLDLYFVCHTPSDVPSRIWGFASDIFVGATDALFPKGRISTASADQIIEAQRIVNQRFRAAKEKGDGSHYGIFKRIQS